VHKFDLVGSAHARDTSNMTIQESKTNQAVTVGSMKLFCYFLSLTYGFKQRKKIYLWVNKKRTGIEGPQYFLLDTFCKNGA
jgi:hypothetical protein